MARAAGTQGERPARKAKRPVQAVDFGLAVLHANGRVLLVKRPSEGLLAGMWAFPETRLGDASTDGRLQVLELARDLGLEVTAGAVPLAPVRHRFTHLEACYRPWSVEVSDSAAPARNAAWVDPTDPGDRALPTAQQRVLESWMKNASEAM